MPYLKVLFAATVATTLSCLFIMLMILTFLVRFLGKANILVPVVKGIALITWPASDAVCAMTGIIMSAQIYQTKNLFQITTFFAESHVK